jgi:precorrin-4/cobalt-precorrin-4 C11-methyltransferase
MKVHFIGAGPGDPELLTLRGRRLIGQCPVCLFAGSLVPEAVVAFAPAGALVRDTAGMTLEETHHVIVEAWKAGLDVARVHSGDPSIYGAIAEQIRLLERDGIAYDVTPGVPAFAGVSAALRQELTVPEIAQSIVLTRVGGKASPMPPGETLEAFAATGATLAIHLGVRQLRDISRRLTPFYGADCPVVVAVRATWPDGQIIRGTLAEIHGLVRAAKVTRTALILVGPALEPGNFRDSALYDGAKPHLLRPERRVKSTS